ncbi:hypothetical protein BH24ACT26_BH24ACT26_10680 [soil metagenome]
MQQSPTSGVISEAWDLYKRHWRHLIPIAAAVYLAVAVLTLLLSELNSVVGAIIATVLSIIGLYWVQGALTRAVQDIRDGKADLSIGDTFRSVASKIGPIAVASILAGIAIGIGFVLLIVPGLYLLTIWSLIVPVIVLEDVGAMTAFARSRELVRGRGWNVFGVVVLTFLILFAFGIVLSIVLAFLDGSMRNFVSNIVSGSLTAPLIALTWTLVYYRLSEGRAVPR